MANGSDEAESAMDRLEAALERIARLGRAAPGAPEGAMPEVKDRLDRVIDRLRAALDGTE